MTNKSWLLLPLTALLFACAEQGTAPTTPQPAGSNAQAGAAASTPQEGGEAASAAPEAAAPQKGGSLTGAGASFPYPLYSKMFAEYQKEAGTSVNYQSVGSGTGQKQILSQTVDFGASDNAMSDEQLKEAPAEIIHLPMALGAVTATYNVPGLDAGNPLKMTGQVLADIYLGKIKTWNDPAIAGLNEGAALPGLPITVVRRSDSSGTTAVFTDFLSKVSPEFSTAVGSGNTVNWPVGTASKGNDGVAGTVASTPGAIGYIEEAYAAQNKMPMMAVQNAAGEFTLPNLAGITAAAAATEMPKDMRTSVTNAAGAGVYPLASYTYLLLYPEQDYGGRSKDQAQRLQSLLQWMLTKGQDYHEALHYGKLPENVRQSALDTVNNMTFGGAPLSPAP